nr:zinc finger, CCHC-type [Tanacetum cinerariifolium]
MAGNTMKEMTTNFGKLDKFERHDFRRWQKKLHFLLTTLKVVYVLTTPMLELLEDATMEAIRIKAKWENDDYICRGHILISMSDSLFDVYTNVESAKELWDSLESKYMAEDSSSKKFLVSNFNNYKMVDSRPVMEQYNDFIGKYIQHGLKMDESVSDSSIIDKLPLSWKDFKHTLKHGKDDLSLVQLGSHLRIEESLRAQDSDKGKVDAIAWWIDSGATTHVCKDRWWFKTFEQVEDESVLYMGDEHFSHVHGKGSVYESDKYILSKCGVFVGFGYYNNGMFMLNLNKVPDDSDYVYMSSSSTVVNTSLWPARLGHVHYKRMLEMSKDELILAIDENPDKCTTSPYTPQKNGVAERKNRALKEMGCRAVVRLPDPKRKTLGEKGIDCIFVGYAEHIKAYMFYVIDPNDSVSINLIIKSRDTIFDENRFYSIPRPKDIIPNSDESQRDDHSDDVPSKITKPRKGKRVWKAKSYGSDFQLYLVEGSRHQVGSQYSYCYSIEEDPRTYNEAMQSRDAALWKEAIDDEIALAAVHNLVIHQMVVKTTFLNGDLDEEVYMKQPEGFVMPGNEHKVCKLVKLLYGLKQVPRQWHQKFDEAVLSSGFHLNQSDKCVYRNFDKSDKGVIICLYVDDMLIFVTDQNQVDKTKKFLSSRFSMKDMGEADVILGIKILNENKGIVITQSHYIEKILKKFNREDCSPVSTHMDPVEKLKPNTGKPVDQLEYSRAIGCLMYAMTSTGSDIAYAIGTLSRFTSNPTRQHWKAITRVFKYLRGNKDYGLSYVGYPSMLEGTISWDSKKQTCITGSTMESEFVELDAAGKEVEWLRNLIHEIPIWPKPIAPISIRCDSAPTMARAYSQIYNRKSRHLDVRHSMVRELIRNGVIFI